MAEAPPRVLIAGAGIGGLCLAQGLRRAGVEVTVFERASSPEEFREGYRLHIDPDGSRALHACLPPDRFDLLRAACGRPPLAFAFLTERLRTLMSVDVVRPGTAPDPVAAHRSVNRYTLRQVLLDGIEEHVRFGKELVRYETDGRNVTAFFADGTEASGRVLVGAEGGRSRVRAQLLPHAERIDTGVISIGGRLPLTADVRALLPPGCAAARSWCWHPAGSTCSSPCTSRTSRTARPGRPSACSRPTAATIWCGRSPGGPAHWVTPTGPPSEAPRRTASPWPPCGAGTTACGGWWR